MENQVTKVLENLGIETREINIYLALINKGTLTALQISKKIRIDRTTIYDILERLIDKGIVSYTIKNKTKHFNALKPKELLIYFKEKYSSLEKILPELNKLASQKKEEIKCELFQGREGLKTILKDLIDTKKDYKAINIRKEYEEILEYFYEQGVLNLDAFKVKEIAIVEKGQRFQKLKRGIYKYLDKKLISPVTTLIYKDKVAFFIWQQPYFAIRVENKTFSKAQKEYFDLLWKIAKK